MSNQDKLETLRKITPEMERLMRLGEKVTPEWERLMRAAHRIDFGRAEVIFQNAKPIRLEIPVKQVRLDMDKDFEDDLKTIPLL